MFKYLLGAVFIMTGFSVQAQITDKVIVVQGVGVVTIDNTQGYINASVTTRNLDADQALTENNTIVANIFNELNGVGVTEDDITTNQFSFHPDYDWDDGQYNFIGYSVTNGITINVSEISTVGAILNLLVDAGVSRINSVSFGSSSLSEVRKQALIRATEDALAKAEILATSTGVNLGRVIQIRLASQSTVLNPSSGSLSVSPPSVTPISPGDNSYQETVLVTYQIEDE